MHTLPPTPKKIRSARSFCLQAISFGVQVAMWGAFVPTMVRADDDVAVIKRTRSATATSEQTLASDTALTTYTAGTDNGAIIDNQSATTTIQRTPALTLTDDNHTAQSLQESSTTDNEAFGGVDLTAIERQLNNQKTENIANNNATLSFVDANQVQAVNQAVAEPTENNEPTVARQTPYNNANLVTARSHLALNSLYKREAKSCQGVWHYPTVNSPTDGVYATANYGYYDNDRYGELSGDVQVVQGERSIFADKLSINPTTGQTNATGQVLFNTGDGIGGGIVGIAGMLNYNLNTGQSIAHDVAFASNSLHAHGYAGQLTANDKNHTFLKNTSFSTCPPDRKHWEISASEIELNKETGRGIARQSTLKIRDKTIAKLPYFNFPIDDRRTSGFLLPKVGINSEDGVELTVPYYFNLAPNYDATITPSIFSNRNPRVAGEFRYLTGAYGGGVLQGAVLPSDRQYSHQNRTHLFFDHLWRFNAKNKAQLGLADAPHWLDNLSASITYRQVSDNDYLSDFDSLGLANNALNLPRRLQFNYDTPNLNASFKAETFQKLEGYDENGNLLLDKDRPYSRLPQLSVNYSVPNRYFANYLPKSLNANNLAITGTHDLAYFKKSIKDGSDTEKSGTRLYNSIAMSYPFVKSWGYVTPKVALSNLTMAYDEDTLTAQNITKQDGTYSVTVPQVSIDGGLHFFKNGSPFNWLGEDKGGYQLLSPRLKYVYSPSKDQSKMPVFESSRASLSYDQLLADSWFLGYDRLGDLHAVTPALSYRYIDKYGQTRLDAGIAEQFLLSDVKVGLTDSTTYAKKGESTGVSWQASIAPYRQVWIDTAGSFKRNYDINTLTVSARYQPNDSTLFSVGAVNRKQDDRLGQLPLSAYTGSAVFKISPQWQVVASAQYDSRRNQLMDTLLGVNYEDCCVGISIYGRQYRNDLRPNAEPNRAIMAEFRLNGLTGKGQLNRLLSEKILGFDNIKDTWQRDIGQTNIWQKR